MFISCSWNLFVIRIVFEFYYPAFHLLVMENFDSYLRHLKLTTFELKIATLDPSFDFTSIRVHFLGNNFKPIPNCLCFQYLDNSQNGCTIADWNFSQHYQAIFRVIVWLNSVIYARLHGKNKLISTFSLI